MIIYKKDFSFGSFTVYDKNPEIDFYRLKQIHSNCVVETPTEMVEADGIYSRQGHTLCVLTADCIPLAVKGKLGHALLHAGWKGVQGQIVLDLLIKKMEPDYFFIGPHIGPCCYEVSDEFRENFPRSSCFSEREEKIFFDLSGELENQIKDSYPQVKIENCRICTCCDKTFHSYRRDKTTKRNWNIVERKD